MPKLVEHIRAAAFDLDGTLVYSASDIAFAANERLEFLGYAPPTKDRIEGLIGGGIDRLVDGVLIESIDRVAGPAVLALYVGDSATDIAAALAADCPVAAVACGYADPRRLAEKHPDWIIGSIAELVTLPAEPRSANAEA